MAVVAGVIASAAHADRGVEQRISWLQERVSFHQYVCKHGAHETKTFHCKALVWTKKELRQAEQEKYNRDWGKPPEPYYSLALCEQRDENGLWGVNWSAYSQSYEGGFGFTHATWRQYREPWMPTRADWATIREQVIVAKKLHATFGNYSSWPACHIKLGLY